jgi:hypothetical protein
MENPRNTLSAYPKQFEYNTNRPSPEPQQYAIMTKSGDPVMRAVLERVTYIHICNCDSSITRLYGRKRTENKKKALISASRNDALCDVRDPVPRDRFRSVSADRVHSFNGEHHGHLDESEDTVIRMPLRFADNVVQPKLHQEIVSRSERSFGG